MQIFLCYAAEDKGIAEPIAFSLRARGHKVFLDRDDLPAGGEYDMRIERAVGQSALFVFLISPASIAKGRFTLSELEFARRKWRKPDGCVLPVMVQPVEMKDVPNFLKSVTILEPQGNVAAEVAAAVAPLAQSAIKAKALVYAGLGSLSGLLTYHLMDELGKTGDIINRNEQILKVPMHYIPAGIAFAAALVAAFAYFYRFQSRQLVIVLFVVGGWFLAMQFALSGWGIVNETGDDTSWVAAFTKQCDSTEAAGRTPVELERACGQFKQLITNHQSSENLLWRLESFAGAGAIGALITILGIPIAVGRPLSFGSYIVVTLAGAIAAAVWGVLLFGQSSPPGFINPPATPYPWYALFVPWQAIVAALIGRSIK